MANTDQHLSDLNRTEEPQLIVPDDEGRATQKDIALGASNNAVAVSPSATAETRPGAAPARPTLVQLGSSSTQFSSSATHHPPKKFNAVNINKKFLEKNSAAAAIATASSTTVPSKSSGAISRPQTQMAQSHSRLVTAKLTASPAPSTATGPGWSRPTSTAPSSTGTSSPIGSSPLPSAATAVPASSTAPQLPHVGKVIQPQPRAAIFQNTNLQKEGSNVKHPAKPAWGSVKPLVTTSNMTSEDFPTAAEVAKATATRKPKQEELKATPEPVSAVKHRLEEEADTFRGVHLDPNAHHWDEMEEDNDDFLGGVIEFGDGRQYKVEATEPAAPSPPPTEDHNEPVSKEERFVDDFDRSWPKSRTSPTSAPRDVSIASPALSSRGNSLHGQEQSQPQLFNERSNKLEPYSHSSRPGQSTYQNRRGSHNDGATSPVDLRSGRDAGFQKSNVQLLQKSGNGELPPRPRAVNGAPSRGGFSSGSFGGDRHRERRDHPPSPRMTRDGWAHHDMISSASVPGRDREPIDRGRRSDMGPPPLPPHAARRPSQEGGRQLPPHISPNMHPSRRLPSRDSRFPVPAPAPVPLSPQSTRFAPPSPSLSHTSTLALSPGASSSVALPLVAGPGADLNEVTKDLMQSAAARAKQRKQEEEAQREAQRERARKKAMELEEKMKAEKEREELEKKGKEGGEARKNEERTKAEAVAFIESAVSSVEGPESAISEHRPSTDAASLQKSLPRRPPSLRGEARKPPAEVSVGTRRPSFGIGTRAAAPDLSPASQAESWRSKVPPLPPSLPAPRQIQSRPAPAATQSSTPEPTQAIVPSSTTSTVLDHAPTIAENFVGDLEATSSSDNEQEKKGQEAKMEGRVESVLPKGRPTASDFFDDKPSVLPSRSDPSVSRRKTNIGEADEKIRGTKEEASASGLRTSGSAPSVKEITSPARVRTHMEASMSALDDVMSRIKGAMQASGANSKEIRPPSDADLLPPRPLQSSTTTKPSPLRERWQAPSKSRSEPRLEGLRESICTVSDPICPPTSEDFIIQLPRVSRRVDPIPRKLQLAFSRPPLPARFDVLTFDPPVEGMSKRDFSVNSVLFRQSGGFKGKRIRVLLPRSKAGGPRTGIAVKYGAGGAFGKPTNADGAATWRRVSPLVPEEKGESKGEAQGAGGEDAEDNQGHDSKHSTKQQEEQPAHARTRQPKMPAGSVVAFYRDSRIDVVEADPKPLVNFIVTSELDEPTSTFHLTTGKGALDESGTGVRNDNAPVADGAKEDGESSTIQSLSPVNSKSGSKTPDGDSTIRSISAPSPNHQTTPWARASLNVPIKDSTVRVPDPEHLKAVWSSTSNKPDLNPVNSLEGIADDLTSVPFSIQDVKSEDGETPPPALPSTTSRMSLHEVTKAFQKVPSSSNSNQSRNPISPPTTTTTPAVRSPYTYSPMAPNAIRPLPAYEHYSPMMSHSPSPTIIYPHHLTSSPVPSRMPVNGHAAVYQQPMWIQPPQNATSAPGNPGNVMRPMMSPYSTPMVPYPTPNTAVYHMGTMSAPPQLPVGTAAGRGRGMSVMSPAMAHATAPMYAGSPVMMHMQVPHQNHAAYMGLPPTAPGAAGRGQPRTESGQVPMPQAHPPAASQPHHPHASYNPSSFVRSPW